jgi:hypothetical protein
MINLNFYILNNIAKATQPDANLDVQGFFENDCMKAGEVCDDKCFLFFL